MSKILTSEEFLNDFNKKHGNIDKLYYDDYVRKAIIEFAKLHIYNIKALQQSKYFSGETGYISNEEWITILNDIK